MLLQLHCMMLNENKANLQFGFMSKNVTCHQNISTCAHTHNVVKHMYVSHHTKQQVSPPGPCNLKLN